MTKRTMQEWADFTGCYALKTSAGCNGCLVLLSEKPIWNDEAKYWQPVRHSNVNISVQDNYVPDLKAHDYRVLVEPHTKEMAR